MTLFYANVLTINYSVKMSHLIRRCLSFRYNELLAKRRYDLEVPTLQPFGWKSHTQILAFFYALYNACTMWSFNKMLRNKNTGN